MGDLSLGGITAQGHLPSRGEGKPQIKPQTLLNDMGSHIYTSIDTQQ